MPRRASRPGTVPIDPAPTGGRRAARPPAGGRRRPGARPYRVTGAGRGAPAGDRAGPAELAHGGRSRSRTTTWARADRRSDGGSPATRRPISVRRPPQSRDRCAVAVAAARVAAGQEDSRGGCRPCGVPFPRVPDPSPGDRCTPGSAAAPDHRAARPGDMTEPGSEHITWTQCPRCGARAAIGWRRRRAGSTEATDFAVVEFDCVRGCLLTDLQVLYWFGRREPGWTLPSPRPADRVPARSRLASRRSSSGRRSVPRRAVR